MTQTISLAAYSIRIRQYNSSEYIPFNEFDGTKDFTEFIKDYVSSADASLDHDSDSKRFFRIDVQKVQSRNRVIEGYIETGEYGFESLLIDQKGKARFKREADMAEMLPFYFSIWLPHGKTTGILIIQRFGQYGASEAFKKSLTKFLRSVNSRVSIEISQVITAKAIKKILSSATVRKVTFRKYQLPNDMADYFDKGQLNEMDGYAEISIVAKRNSKLPVSKWINRVLGDKEIDYLVEEKVDPGKREKSMGQKQKQDRNKKTIKSGAIAHDPDTIKVEFGIGQNGGTRTIDLTNLNIFRSYFDITNEIRFEINGHPSTNSLKVQVEKLRGELKELLYPKQDV